ncbi:uncharacterized protein LOC111026828 [Myzus persicae]|uniref:uncharacterized protein LOC111026828 n=1 Tax=Myzus persicae TaxID=13164 RepID=UPI000B939853|nr:uncharacterized protein LOC111026828 [Myzus persicae]
MSNSCSRAQYYDRNDARARYAVVTPKRTREQHLGTRQCGYELAGRTAREATTDRKAPTPDTRRAARTDIRRNTDAVGVRRFAPPVTLRVLIYQPLLSAEARIGYIIIVYGDGPTYESRTMCISSNFEGKFRRYYMVGSSKWNYPFVYLLQCNDIIEFKFHNIFNSDLLDTYCKKRPQSLTSFFFLSSRDLSINKEIL